MKNFIKTMLAASLMLAGASLQAAQAPVPKVIAETPTTFTQFSQLPSDVQTQIISAINEGSTPLDAAKRLGQLRRVSKQMKAIIESPYTGKQLMQKIADRFSKYKTVQNEYALFNAMLSLKTPGAFAWQKEQLLSGKVSRNIFDFSLKRAISNNQINAQQILQLVGDPNYITDKDSEKPEPILFEAAKANNLPLINDLIAAGADINLVAHSSTIHCFGTNYMFMQMQKTALDMFPLRKETVDLLRSRGAKTSRELPQEQGE